MTAPSSHNCDPREFAGEGPLDGLAEQLMRGGIAILRDVPQIRAFRAAIERAVGELADAPDVSLRDFYATGAELPLATVQRLAEVIRRFRRERVLSAHLAPLIGRAGFPEPIRLDGGISRLVLSAGAVSKAKHSGRFPDIAFQRASADGEVEVFMAKPANIHRDFNRPHFLFQANLWFPLHDAGEDDVLRIFPRHYRARIYNMETAPDAFAALGAPLRYRLRFGDTILFHGEHLHTSPSAPPGERRRHSYDFRIAAASGDDNAHYRQHFLDLRNFSGGAYDALCRFERLDTPSAEDCAAALIGFDGALFAEDRYALLGARAEAADAEVAVACWRRVAGSPLWFWRLRAAEALLRLGLREEARDAFAVARAHAAADRPWSYAPIAYEHAQTQMRPADAVQRCEAVLATI